MDNPNDSELWEFVNPFFKRNHQHLLSKVMRKNNRPANAPPSTGSTGTRSSARQQASQTPGYASQFLITDGTTEGEAGTIVGTSGQQMIDLAAITSGIAAIRQTQASIGADLKALQASNEHLWREALDSRERHRKHQETIDLIVSFLERLFGTEGEGLKGLKEALRRGGIGRPREDSGSEEVVGKKRKRLGLDRMISDGRNEEPRLRDDQIVEIQDGTRMTKLIYIKLTLQKHGMIHSISLFHLDNRLIALLLLQQGQKNGLQHHSASSNCLLTTVVRLSGRQMFRKILLLPTLLQVSHRPAKPRIRMLSTQRRWCLTSIRQAVHSARLLQQLRPRSTSIRHCCKRQSVVCFSHPPRRRCS